jgi:hypothetical protein
MKGNSKFDIKNCSPSAVRFPTTGGTVGFEAEMGVESTLTCFLDVECPSFELTGLEEDGGPVLRVVGF